MFDIGGEELGKPGKYQRIKWIYIRYIFINIYFIGRQTSYGTSCPFVARPCIVTP